MFVTLITPLFSTPHLYARISLRRYCHRHLLPALHVYVHIFPQGTFRSLHTIPVIMPKYEVSIAWKKWQTKKFGFFSSFFFYCCCAPSFTLLAAVYLSHLCWSGVRARASVCAVYAFPNRSKTFQFHKSISHMWWEVFARNGRRFFSSFVRIFSFRCKYACFIQPLLWSVWPDGFHKRS